MITLILLHPIQSIPMQKWKFAPATLIRVGRSSDNDVVLYSAVVSRRHLEIKYNSSAWELVNLGSNGTYIDGKKINQTPLIDGMVIRLANSGPQIKVNIDSLGQDKQTQQIKKSTSHNGETVKNIRVLSGQTTVITLNEEI